MSEEDGVLALCVARHSSLARYDTMAINADRMAELLNLNEKLLNATVRGRYANAILRHDAAILECDAVLGGDSLISAKLRMSRLISVINQSSEENSGAPRLVAADVASLMHSVGLLEARLQADTVWLGRCRPEEELFYMHNQVAVRFSSCFTSRNLCFMRCAAVLTPSFCSLLFSFSRSPLHQLARAKNQNVRPAASFAGMSRLVGYTIVCQGAHVALTGSTIISGASAEEMARLLVADVAAVGLRGCDNPGCGARELSVRQFMKCRRVSWQPDDLFDIFVRVSNDCTSPPATAPPAARCCSSTLSQRTLTREMRHVQHRWLWRTPRATSSSSACS